MTNTKKPETTKLINEYLDLMNEEMCARGVGPYTPDGRKGAFDYLSTASSTTLRGMIQAVKRRLGQAVE